MARSLCAAVIACALAAPAHAQSPRAGGPAPGDDPTTRLAAELAATGSLARGFVDRELIATRAIVQGWTGPWGLYVQPYWLYGRVATPMGKLTTDNELYVRTGLFRSLSRRFYAYAVNASDRSLRRQIEARALTGAGAGVHVLRGKDTSLHASVGALYELTDFEGAPEWRQTGRSSVRVYGRYKLAGGRLALVHDLIVIPAIRAPIDDYRILFYGAIDAPIAKGFAARIQADATRESVIVEGTQHDDLNVTFGLSYRAEWQRD